MSDQRDSLRGNLIDFLADPKTFMRSNIVLPPMSPRNQTISGTGSGIFQFSFEKSTVSASNPLFRIGLPDAWNADKPRFMAYYCHYSFDETFDLMLGDEMDLMLTPTMNGCSFGVGSATATGGRRVAHANVSRTENTARGITQQGIAQAGSIGGIIPGARIIGPADYLDTDVYGTTVGVRNRGRWSFFMQRWERPTSSNYILKGIVDIA
jgi:hypothetical protein